MTDVDETALAYALEKLADDLPETISIDDLERHEWLRRTVLAADRISNSIGRRELDWLKSQ